jgi:hypothetical protein
MLDGDRLQMAEIEIGIDVGRIKFKATVEDVSEAVSVSSARQNNQWQGSRFFLRLKVK